MDTTAIKPVMNVSSPVFTHQQHIPSHYTCDGAGVSPPLLIQGIPEETISLALIVEDPDAPERIFDHWIVWNIPPDGAIAENSTPGLVGSNSLGENEYTGPCPPSGTHRYFFKVYALNTLLNLAKGANKRTLEQALQNHIIAYGELVGLYARKKP